MVSFGVTRMSEKQIFRFVHDEARRRASAYCMIAPEGSIAEFKDATRTLEQNAKMWPMLKDIAKQVEWYENWLTQDEWKDFFSAIILKQKVIPNMEGTGFIAVGGRTSKMGKRMFSEMIELMYAFGSDHNVVWSEESKSTYQELRRSA